MFEEILQLIKGKGRKRHEYSKKEIDGSCARTKMLSCILENYRYYNYNFEKSKFFPKPGGSGNVTFPGTQEVYGGRFSGGAVYENYLAFKKSDESFEININW